MPTWSPYFTVHGDPYVVSDPDRPFFSIIASVSTDPEDYGRSNTLLLAAAPDLLDFVRTVAKSGCDNYGDCRFHPAYRSRCVACQATEILSWFDT